MGIDNNVSVTGNVTRDPELRFTQGGMAVASFGLAWNKRKQDGEEEVSFFDVTCFRSLAENVASPSPRAPASWSPARCRSAAGKTRTAKAVQGRDRRR